MPTLSARTKMTGLAQSTMEASMGPRLVSMTSTGLPVGRSLPVAAPAVPDISIWMRAPVPGTPAMATSPVTFALPSSTRT